MRRFGRSVSAMRRRGRSRRPKRRPRPRPQSLRSRSRRPRVRRRGRACSTACAVADAPLSGTVPGMRRSLTWLVAVPLFVAGSQAAHALAYRLVYPGASVRVRALLLTGHSYLDRLPLALGVSLAIALVALLVAVLDASRGRPSRALPAWAFGALAPLAFALQEILELSLHTGTFAWHA